MRLLPSLNFPAVGAAYVRQVARPNATPLETFFHEQIYPAQSRFFALRLMKARRWIGSFLAMCAASSHAAFGHGFPLMRKSS